MRRNEGSVFYGAVIAVCVVLLVVLFFMMISLWADRVVVSWLLLGLVVLAVCVGLALLVIRTVSKAKVLLDEEKLRPGRLYAHERLIEDGGQKRDEWGNQRQQAVMDEPYVQRPYEYEAPRHVPVPDVRHDESYSGYSGPKPLSIDSYDWDEKH